MAQPLPHTIDNLCKKDREKIVSMLRQFKEYKQQCSALEKEFEEQQLESSRLEGREEMLTGQLEVAQAKLYEAIQVSQDAQSQIEELTTRLQKIESQKAATRRSYREAQSELQTIRDDIGRLRNILEQPRLDVGTECINITMDRSVNTEEGGLGTSSIETQTDIREWGEYSSTFNDFSPLDSGITRVIQPDEEVDQLISLLKEEGPTDIIFGTVNK